MFAVFITFTKNKVNRNNNTCYIIEKNKLKWISSILHQYRIISSIRIQQLDIIYWNNKVIDGLHWFVKEVCVSSFAYFYNLIFNEAENQY